VLAGVDVRRTSGISDLLLSYTGGGSFGNGGGTQSGGIQELSFRDSLSFRRLKLSVFEQLSYLPESSFGFAGTAGSGMPVGGGLNLGTGLTPGQSILSPPGQNLSSSTAVESDIRLTPRSSLTFVGAYALLRNFDTDLANFGDTNFQAGYNYQLTRKDTIAVSYQFSAYRYSNLGQSINADTIQGSYGRRVNGRLAFQIGAGPQFVSSTNPILGATSAPSSTTGSATTLSWSLNSSLQYRFRRVALAASYSHGLNGGSGLLSGAETDIVTGSVGEQVSRTFSAALSMGYSRNSGYAAAAANPSTAQKYSYWFTGVTVTHPVNRSLDVFMNYQLQYQDNSTNGCVVSGCSTNLIRNQIAFGMNMHRQPIPF